MKYSLPQVELRGQGYSLRTEGYWFLNDRLQKHSPRCRCCFMAHLKRISILYLTVSTTQPPRVITQIISMTKLLEVLIRL